jgi:hypothetical protein
MSDTGMRYSGLVALARHTQLTDYLQAAAPLRCGVLGSLAAALYSTLDHTRGIFFPLFFLRKRGSLLLEPKGLEQHLLTMPLASVLLRLRAFYKKAGSRLSSHISDTGMRYSGLVTLARHATN